MKADPFRQLRLLDLQALDTRLAQLAHSRKVLPQHAEIAELEGHAKTLDDELVRVRTAVGDVEREVAKAEADVQLVRDRAERDRSRLDAGVGTSKDLLGLQHELETLARRQSELEDIELEVMERAEALQSDLSELTAGRERLTERMDGLVAARDAAVAEPTRRPRRSPPPVPTSSPSAAPSSSRSTSESAPTAGPGPRPCGPGAAEAASSSSTTSSSAGSRPPRRTRSSAARSAAASSCAPTSRGCRRRGATSRRRGRRRIRGNPGVAGYGALVRDPGTGAVLAERAAPLGKQSTTSPSTPA